MSSGGFSQFFVTDINEDDIACQYGENENKFVLFDKFSCWDEGEYIGEVSEETIAKLRKVN